MLILAHSFLHPHVICLSASTPQSNRQVSGETITFRSVSTENTAVYQCNASNEHGYLLANAFVNVLRKFCYLENTQLFFS